ncbi:MAG TPA: efflux RND transporter permease subunit [Thermomicrobiales bacterium]|nr:efflux RND transporter permease subunit [Thermomicrobiales bacterium]
MSRLVSWITEQAYRRAAIVIIAVVLLLFYGTYTLTTVRQELIPDIEFPLATVIVQSPGDQPDQIANNVIAPIEAATSGATGLNSTESTSVAGLGVILYSFEFGTSLEDIERELQDALDATQLGPDVQASVLTFDPASFPIFIFDLQGDLSESELLQVANTQVVPELTNLEGVATVEVVGGAIDEVHITLDRAALLERGISYDQVAGALQANNVILPSGQLPSGDALLPIETISILNSIDTIRAIAIPAADGSLVTIGDLGTVEIAEGTPVGYSRTDGQPSISIRVTKTKDANTVEVSERVVDALDEIEDDLPAGASISIFENQAEYISESIRSMVEEGVIGGVLAVIVVFAFLGNWRTTLITAVSIPLSLISAIVVLDQFGYSLNIMTLAGLTIAIGRVIDDSIVVLENVYRHMSEGEPPFAAIVNGAREVTIAILGATATTCAVFLPIGLVGGLIGQLFLPFALAVVAALVASLVVAVTVIPVLARFALANKVKVEPEKRPADTRLGRLYTPALVWALNNRWKTLIASVLLFFGSMALIPLLPVTFLPDSGENVITISVNASPGQTAESVLEQSIEIEGILEEMGAEGYQTVITGASGDIGAIANILSGNSTNSATITAELPSDMDKQDVAEELRHQFEEDPEFANVTVSAAAADGFSSSSVSITLAAESPAAAATLPDFAAQVADAVASVDDIANVSTNLSAVQPSVEVRVDPSLAAEAGLTPEQISSQIANLSSNQTITVAALEEGTLPVRMQLTGANADSVEDLASLEISQGVVLGDVAELVEVEKQVSITRVDGRTAATVSGDISSDNTGGVSAEAQQAVDKLEAPDGVEVLFGGVAGDIEEGFTNMIIAILISIVLVYGIMAALFRSWLDPLVILSTLPLAAIGAIVALLVTGSALSLSSMIGMLMLVGIVVTNAIVMLEFVIMLRKERDYPLREALIEGAQTRVRPILMTAFAAMLALVPLSLGLTEGLLIASDLGRVVIGGLFSSTLLTLLVIPVVYSLADGMRNRVARRFGRGPLVTAPATAGPSLRNINEPGDGE